MPAANVTSIAWSGANGSTGVNATHATLDGPGHGGLGPARRRRSRRRWPGARRASSPSAVTVTVREHGLGVDVLIERGDEHRLQRQVLAVARRRDPGPRPAAWRTRPRRPAASSAPLADAGAGGHGDRVVGRHRQAVPVGGVEAQRRRADPLPASLDGRRDGRRHVGRGQLGDRADGDHRLVERDRQERRQPDLARRLDAQHLERLGRRRRRIDVLVGRERDVGLLALGAGDRLGRPVELGGLGGVGVERWEPVEDARRRRRRRAACPRAAPRRRPAPSRRPRAARPRGSRGRALGIGRLAAGDRDGGGSWWSWSGWWWSARRRRPPPVHPASSPSATVSRTTVAAVRSNHPLIGPVPSRRRTLRPTGWTPAPPGRFPNFGRRASVGPSTTPTPI